MDDLYQCLRFLGLEKSFKLGSLDTDATALGIVNTSNNSYDDDYYVKIQKAAGMQWLDFVYHPDRGLIGTFFTQGYSSSIGGNQLSFTGGTNYLGYTTIFTPKPLYTLTKGIRYSAQQWGRSNTTALGLSIMLSATL